MLGVFHVYKKTQKQQPVVLLQHGMFQDGTAWILRDKEEPRAFLLANAGYDVWIGNSRGTQFSKVFDESDFSWEEMGKYDLPAVTKFIKKKTGVEKMTYIGYSLGTTQMFYSLATHKTDIENSINLFVAIAPCTLLANTEHPAVKVGSDYYGLVKSFVDTFKIGVVLHPKRAAQIKIYESCLLLGSLCEKVGIQKPEFDSHTDVYVDIDLNMGSGVHTRSFQLFA